MVIKSKKKKSKATGPMNPSNGLVHEKLLKLSIASSPVIICLYFFLPSYFPISIAEKMVFLGADGNCISAQVKLGQHCFGDYGAPILLIDQISNPWATTNPLMVVTPFVLIAFKFFAFLNTLPAPLIPLTIFIMLLIYCGIYPVLKATSGTEVSHRLKSVAFLSFMTLPIFAVIDRANNSVWAVPLIYLSIVSLIEKKEFRAALFMAMAISIRPQMLFLVILFLPQKKFSAIFKTLLISFGVYYLSFILYLQTFSLMPFVNFAQGLIQYGSGIPGTWPPNLSMARGLRVLLGWTGASPADATIIYVSYALIGLVLLFIISMPDKNDTVIRSILTIPLIFLLAPMSWAYYGVFLQISIALMIKYQIRRSDMNYGRGFFYLLLTSMFATQTLLYLPFLDGYNNVIQFVVPVLWVLLYSSFVLLSLKQKILKEL